MLYVYVLLSICPLYSYRRFIVTGGSGVGKSSVISLLKSQGNQVSSDAYELLYNRLGKETIDAMEPGALLTALMAEELKIERGLATMTPAFLDKSAYDILFRSEYLNAPISSKLAEDIQKNRYDGILFLEEPLKTTAQLQETHDFHEFLRQKYQAKAKELNIPFVSIPYASVQERVKNIITDISNYYFYADIIDCFAGKNSKYPIENFFGPVKLITIQSADKKTPPYKFFGVHKDKQPTIDFKAFKQKLTSFLNINPKKSIQLIGDSNQFTTQGSQYAAAFIKERLDASQGLIEYGFTGYIRGQDFDVNSLVSNYIDNNPAQAYRALGNILGHTHLALRLWGTFGSSLVRNFMVVYNDSGMQDNPVYDANGKKVKGFTTFGDDVTISDYIFHASDSDYFICLEGGAQSFEQCTHALQSGIPILCVCNLRKPENKTMFSATHFFSLIDQEFINDVPPARERVLKVYNDYVKGLTTMFNEKKPDFLTKKEIFERAISAFIEGGLYMKVHTLCTFFNAEKSAI